MTRVIAGHCLCNAVRVELAEPAAEVEICQCAMCRRWGGAFYAAQTGADFTLHGAENITVYKSSDWGSGPFVPPADQTCGSNSSPPAIAAFPPDCLMMR